MKPPLLLLVAACLGSAFATRGDTAFSDPANVPPPPAGSIGFASRAADLDALPGFAKPPPGFGDVGFFWWLGDKLTRERLQWQLDQLAGKGISGLQINYAHDDKGGRTYGLTFPSDPPVFSEEWWSLYQWFLKAAKEKGIAVSLSDYTLGTAGQGSYIDAVLEKNPGIRGATLANTAREVDGGAKVTLDVPANTVSLVAFKLNGADVVPGSGVDLRGSVRDGRLAWTAPAGTWRIFQVRSETHELSIDPMNPLIGQKVIGEFFQKFEDRNPGEAGKGLNFFFSDELQFGVAGNLWNDAFAKTFRERKGYDLLPELPALFADIGPRTPKIRLDYHDLVVALQEEGYFKPLFDWHQKRGMIYGCDHGGRGRNVSEFGDYFRTQRWNQGPGTDQPHLAQDLTNAKVAASIAHLYNRPRVWLEGFYSSGWGTGSADVANATFANFAMGYNLLTLHGLYYSTHGGYWEWAPPCNHFHMPYWRHMGVFLDCVQRLSYLMSQGDHRCDVAVMYPVEAKQAGLDGDASVDAAFRTGGTLYGAGIDFDYMDTESLERAKVVDGKLRVSGEEYRALVIPSMRALRFSTLQKAAELQRAGGLVIVLGAAPEASERAGRDDAALNALVARLTTRAGDPAGVLALVEKAFPRDYTGPGKVNHRRVGNRDVYMIYDAPKGSECLFRATGKVELWNPWTGTTSPLPVLAQDAAGTRLSLPLGEREPQLIVFSPGTAEIRPAAAAPAPQTVAVEGDWEFELVPVLDNRFGDYHWPPTPALIGAEVRKLETTTGDPARGPWRKVTCSFGPMFWKLGPLPDGFDDRLLSGLSSVDPSNPVEFGGKQYRWEPYEFSWRWGREGDPGHQGYHGLKNNVTDEFICLGAPRDGKNETLYGPEPGGSRYYLWTSVPVASETQAHPRSGGLRPAAVWVNHQPAAASVQLKPGANPVLLRYDHPGRGYFVMDRNPGAAPAAGDDAFTAAAQWIWYPGERANGDRWFRKAFDLPSVPKAARLRITCDNGYSVSVNGSPVGAGTDWARVEEYDLAGLLRPGRNTITVRATNTGASAGLIAEVAADATTVGSDATWQVAQSENGAYVAAESQGAFAGSLWYTHEQGPPRVVAAAPKSKKPVFEDKPLAMTFYKNSAILPFDAQPENRTRTAHYRFNSPPGLRGLTIQVAGKAAITAAGRPLKEVSPGVFQVEKAESGSVPVLITVNSEAGAYGGAAIPEYIKLDCGPGKFQPGDWAKNDGLLSYSGGATYRKTVDIPKAGLVTLDLGNVVASAEVRVNGRPAGIRVAPPWTFDLSGLVQPGENTLEVLVFNTLANHYTSIPTKYLGPTTAGLLGPVTLQITP